VPEDLEGLIMRFVDNESEISKAMEGSIAEIDLTMSESAEGGDNKYKQNKIIPDFDDTPNGKKMPRDYKIKKDNKTDFYEKFRKIKNIKFKQNTIEELRIKDRFSNLK
jgi:hypothetical protein